MAWSGWSHVLAFVEDWVGRWVRSAAYDAKWTGLVAGKCRRKLQEAKCDVCQHQSDHLVRKMALHQCLFWHQRVNLIQKLLLLPLTEDVQKLHE